MAYRDALNYAYKIAFYHRKIASANKLQKLFYQDIRANLCLSYQMSCNVPRQVAATYKWLWIKVKQNGEHLKAWQTQNRYKGLDWPPKYVSIICNLNYKRNYSFVKQGVSLITLQGRIKVPYAEYSKHV